MSNEAPEVVEENSEIKFRYPAKCDTCQAVLGHVDFLLPRDMSGYVFGLRCGNCPVTTEE